mmetsp:Transcript_16447/g.40511  ORF Transcript_16447/g.40511 Transcript_16447/m.40511 type:complete len:293 (-) Transcript_16447:184-1062(-)
MPMQPPPAAPAGDKNVHSNALTPIRDRSADMLNTTADNGDGSGWVRYYDEASGYYYFAKVMWEKPDEGWVDHKDVPPDDSLIHSNALGTPLRHPMGRPYGPPPWGFFAQYWKYIFGATTLVLVLGLLLINTLTLRNLVDKWRTGGHREEPTRMYNRHPMFSGWRPRDPKPPFPSSKSKALISGGKSWKDRLSLSNFFGSGFGRKTRDAVIAAAAVNAVAIPVWYGVRSRRQCRDNPEEEDVITLEGEEALQTLLDDNDAIDLETDPDRVPPPKDNEPGLHNRKNGEGGSIVD